MEREADESFFTAEAGVKFQVNSKLPRSTTHGCPKTKQEGCGPAIRREQLNLQLIQDAVVGYSVVRCLR